MADKTLRGVGIGSIRSREADMLGNVFATLREIENGTFSKPEWSKPVIAHRGSVVPDND